MARQKSLRKRAMAGETVLGSMVFEFFTPGIAQILKLAGSEYVIYDMEHAGFTIEQLRRSAAVAWMSRRWFVCQKVNIASLLARWMWAPKASWFPWLSRLPKLNASSKRPVTRRSDVERLWVCTMTISVQVPRHHAGGEQSQCADRSDRNRTRPCRG